MSLVEFVSARLRELRARHDLTQEQMAHLLDTDVKWYQRVEWCDKDLRASSIDRLAAVFGLTATQFLAADLPDTVMRSNCFHPLRTSRAKQPANRSHHEARSCPVSSA